MCAFANGVFYTSEPYPRSMVGTPDADGTQDSYVNMDLSRNSSVYSVVPNSSGILRVIDGQYGIFSPESTGVFKVDPGTNKINVTVAQNYQGDNHAFFDLSGANAIYGGSSTVQPAGLYGLYLVRAYEA